MFRVYDERTNETLFKHMDNIECIVFVANNFDEGDEDFEYIWVEKIQ